MKTNRGPAFLVILSAIFLTTAVFGQQADPSCERTIWADVVALDQPYLTNRLGASMPEGMVYALERDVMAKACANQPGPCNKPLVKGDVMLKPYKRPRPIVLRANVGDCLQIHFTNLLASGPVSTQPATRQASIHVAGMEVVKTINSDGSFAGTNANSNIAPGDNITYLLRATAEGTFLINSMGAMFGGQNQPNDGAQVTAGLFGAVNVEPKNSEWYRSQVTHADLEFAINTAITGGFSTFNQPFIKYDAKFPAGHEYAGLPVLRMLDDKNHIIYTDLTAIITGPKAGKWPAADAAKDPNLAQINIEPNRLDPYREFTIGYHELMDAVQAFPIYDEFYPNGPPNKNILAPTISPGGDAFAINYGTGGIGSEILANRFGLGPMGSCSDCRFEEFFLSSWTVGDPAMLVDVPANSPCSNVPINLQQKAVTSSSQPAAPCTTGVAGNAPSGITPYRKATKVFYPDDPSNVYHSYINDRVKFRILHTGTGVSHVHHLHAHQWVHSPNSDFSTYLDSQLINPGSAYTLEIAFNGGGNRNKTVGDSIFHCHFYPHFAAGMWALWRTHDVYEVGSPFSTTNFPNQLNKYKTRALPDGEIAAGTPIPAIIPMPTLMMPPMPGPVAIQAVADPNGGGSPVGWEAVPNLSKNENPGYPFFIPGVAGTRAPHPPMDFAVDNGQQLDGGLPRHILINAKITNEQHTILNFSKDYDKVNAYELPEQGTAAEQVAMKFHATCFHASFTPGGVASVGSNQGFRTNGLPPASGAPYADPGLVPYPPNNPPANECVAINNWRRYKAAVIQTDLVLNKQGWHYPQSRYLTLWGNVLENYNSDVAQHPFFIRANAGEGVEYWHTNLVPDYYALDDYQVRTPTDIIGQHIHLVKFDVTSSDGAANGYNYEDGTLSYGEVKHLIDGITQCGGLATGPNTISNCGNAANRKPLTKQPPPQGICPPAQLNMKPCSEWFGAQTTVQRWQADPIPADNGNGTRTLRTVFTHDHFGPSTHQQTGLYAALLVEPTGSKWFHSETGTPLGTMDDGGPTTWNAIISTEGSEANTYREFALAMQDFQFAYKSNSKNNENPDPNIGWSDPKAVIEPPFGGGLGGSVGPQIVSAGPTSGTTSFSYRNEPLPFRVAPPGANPNPDPKASDLAYVFMSTITRNLASVNTQPTPGASINPALNSKFIFPKKPLTSGMMPGDPYTPLLRAYEGDRVQIRVVAGAHMLPHAFTVGGIKWLFEPSWDDSGYRSSQSMGISEHFNFLFRTPRASPSKDPNIYWTDYLYMPDASNQKHGLIDGTWGIFRAYKSTEKTPNLVPLPTNKTVTPLKPANGPAGYSCPPNAPMKTFRVQSRTPGAIPFNKRGTGPAGLFPPWVDLNNPGTAIVNFYPMMYRREDNPDTTEPLILRANAGDCLAVTVANAFNPNSETFDQSSTAAFAKNISLFPSHYTGLTPALLSYDAMASTGLNVGFNPEQTIPIATSANYANKIYPEKTYYWYAGQTTVAQDGTITGLPIELGGVNLTPADPLEQDLHGLIGGFVIEPPGAIACVDTFDPSQKILQYASATVYGGGTCQAPGKLLYREFVLITQDDLTNVEWSGSTAYIGADSITAPGGTTALAVNYRTEPMPYRYAASQNSFVSRTDLYKGYWDGLVIDEPQTPIFAAAKGTPTRFRLLHPAGSGNQQIMALHGHVWQELPYVSGGATQPSTMIGNNTRSQYLGARDNYGTNMSYEFVLPSAGGIKPVGGDYLWRTTPSNYIQQGLWGLFRVADGGADAVRIGGAQYSSGNLFVHGSTSVFLDSKANPRNGQRATTISLFLGKKGQQGTLLSDKVPVGENGLWSYMPCTWNPTPPPPCSPVPTLGVGNDAMQITAVSPNGGTFSLPLDVVTGPPQPSSPSATPSALDAAQKEFRAEQDATPVVPDESSKFVAQPRDHGEKNPKPDVTQEPPVLEGPPPAKPPL